MNKRTLLFYLGWVRNIDYLATEQTARSESRYAMKLRTFLMLALVFAFAATVGTLRLYAQNDHEHPDHDRSESSSHDAPDHDAQSHDGSGHDVSGHDRSAQDTMDRNMENAKEVSERQAQERDREAMRNKDHDGRLKIDDHTSVGGRLEPGGASVNVKMDIDRPK